VFRYSATHKEKINLLYRLTPVDAYQMGLVKQICVSSNTIEHDFNKPYIRLLDVSMDNGFRARIEIDIRGGDGRVERKNKTVKTNDDLFLLSGERDLYEGYVIENIDCTPGKEQVEFTNTEFVPLGKAIGAYDENLIKRAQIRRTMVLRGVTADGKILIADPASVTRTNQEWDLSIILDESRRGASAGGPFWILSK